MASALVVSDTPSASHPSGGIVVSRSLHKMAEEIAKAWTWLQSKKAERLQSRRLHLIEKVSLGESRFVAVLQVDKQQFLIGSGPTGVALLASLDGPQTFDGVLKAIPEAQKLLSKPRGRKPKRPVGTAA